MKSFKALSLISLSALVVMATIGATSAFAQGTALCSQDPGEGPSEVCPEEQLISHLKAATLEGHRAALLSGEGSFLARCEVSFLGDVVEGSGLPRRLEGQFSYTSCASGCSITEVSAHTILEVSKLGHETANVTGEGEFHAVCELNNIDCYFDWEGLTLTAKGPLLATEANGEISVLKAKLHQVKGSLCPETVKLDITLNLSSATYIESAPSTALCSQDPGAGPSEICPEEHLVSHVKAATLEGQRARLLDATGVNNFARCEVSFLGDVIEGAGLPLLLEGQFSYTNCASGCSITEESAHTTLAVSKLGHETANVTGEGEFHALCSGIIDCYFDWKGLTLTAKGPLLATEKNGEISVLTAELHQVKGSLCPETVKLDITLNPASATYITY